MAKQFITSSDLDDERDNTGIVHDGDYDHPGTGTLASGYLYGGPSHALYTNGLVGWWPLHEQSGQANDLSGNGNHGSVSGATQGVAGKGGLTAYSFDGSGSDYITTTFDLGASVGTGDVTISTWVKTRSGSTENAWLFGDQENSNNYISLAPTNSNGDIYIRDGSSGITGLNADFALDDDKWHHIVFTRTGTTASLYVDAGLHDRKTDGEFGVNPDSDHRIGQWNSNNAFDGVVADHRVYDRVLSTSEIQTLYEWGSGDYARPADDGVNYYSFNSSGATDQWGSNDGTVNGATYVSDGGPRGDGAYSFDGMDDYIDTGISWFNSDHSISAWFKLDNTSTGSTIWGIRDNAGTDQRFYLWNDTGGRLELGIGSGPTILELSNSHVADSWYHAVVTWDESTSTATAYLNGIAVVSGGENTNPSGVPYIIGDMATGGGGVVGNTMSGDIDDVRIYDRTLEPWEIQELYQFGTLGRDMRHFTVNAI